METTVRFAELPDILTVDEAADYLRLGRSSVYDAIKQRIIPGVRIGRRILVPKAGLHHLMDGNTREDIR